MKSSANDLPIFVKTHNFLDWLIPATKHFPRLHRHTITHRLVEAALNFQEALLSANAVRNQERLHHLTSAGAELNKVSHYLRLIHGWQWLSLAQYEHVSRMVAELGRLLGGWRKITGNASGNVTVAAVL